MPNIPDLIVIAVIAGIVGCAVFYIIRQKKKGVKCIGCPHAKTCNGCCNHSVCDEP